MSDGSSPVVRIDQWLWAVRLFKTRSMAAAACRGGHVEINGRTAKPASPLHVGDRVEAQLERRRRIVEVTKLTDKRVGATIAVTCFADHSPAVEPREAEFMRREPGAGRPTKRDRRRLDDLRGR